MEAVGFAPDGSVGSQRGESLAAGAASPAASHAVSTTELGAQLEESRTMGSTSSIGAVLGKSVDFVAQATVSSYDSRDSVHSAADPTALASADSVAPAADPASFDGGAAEDPAETVVRTSAVVEALWEMCDEDELRELAFAFTSCDVDDSNALEADELHAMLVMHAHSVTAEQVSEVMKVGKALYADWSDGQISEEDKDIMLDKMLGAAGMQLGRTKHGAVRTFAELNIQERHKALKHLVGQAGDLVMDTTKGAAKMVEEQSKAAASLVEEKTGVLETTRKAATMVEEKTGVMEQTRKAATLVDDKTGASEKARQAATHVDAQSKKAITMAQDGADGIADARRLALETARKAAKDLEEQSRAVAREAEERAKQGASLVDKHTEQTRKRVEENSKKALAMTEATAKGIQDTSKKAANLVESKTGVVEMTKQSLNKVENATGVLEQTRRAANLVDEKTGATDKAKLAANFAGDNTIFLAMNASDQLAVAKRALQLKRQADKAARAEEELSVDFAEYLFTMQSKEMQDLISLDPHTLAVQMRLYRNAFDMVDVDGDNQLEFDELEMVVLSLNPHLMLTDDDLLYLWGVLTHHTAEEHAKKARREAEDEREAAIQGEMDEVDVKISVLDAEEAQLERRLKLRFSGELTSKEENWIRRRCGKLTEERDALLPERQRLLEILLNPGSLPEPEPEPEVDVERPGSVSMETAPDDAWSMVSAAVSVDAGADHRLRESVRVGSFAQIICEGMVTCQYGGKGDFETVWMSVGTDGLVMVRDCSGMPPNFKGTTWQGEVLRTASALQSGVRLPKKRRRGHKSAIRVDLAKRDTGGDIKYLISGASKAMTLEKLQKTLQSFAIGRWDDSRAITLNFNAFLHGMAAVQLNERTCQWINIFKPNRWELLSLIIDTPVSEADEERIFAELSAIERVGIGMLRRQKGTEMDMANMRSVLTKAGAGELRYLEKQQVDRMHHLHDKAVLISALIGLLCAGLAALAENIMCYELGVNGFKDAYWVCSLESALDLDWNSTTYGNFTPMFPELAHPDAMLCTTVHVNASSCLNGFMETAAVTMHGDIHNGAGYYPPGTTAEDLSDVFGHHANGLHGWTTLETGSETMEHICTACQCVVCGCATHAPVIGRVELGADNKQAVFWGILGPILVVTMAAEISLLLYCAMRYTIRVAWALDIRLTPLNTDRAFVAESLVRAAFELGNPDSPLLGVDPQEEEGDASKVLMLLLFKLKMFLTGSFVKFIIGLTCSPETSLWLKPWLGMVASVIVWDSLTCHNLMVQARIRGFGVYASVELFNEIIDESYEHPDTVDAVDVIGPLAKIQIARAVGVAIVIHGSLHPSMELLLRHALQFLGLRGTKFVAEPGVLDNREGFIRDLNAGAWAVFESEEELQEEEDSMPLGRQTSIALSNPIYDDELSEDAAAGAGVGTSKDKVGLKNVSMAKRVRRQRSSGLWSMMSGDETNAIERMSREDQIAVLCVHLLAFLLDGFFDPKELELWEQVCEAVGPQVAKYYPERIAHVCDRFREMEAVTARDLRDCFDPTAEVVIPAKSKLRALGFEIAQHLSF